MADSFNTEREQWKAETKPCLCCFLSPQAYLTLRNACNRHSHNHVQWISVSFSNGRTSAAVALCRIETSMF